MNEKWFLYPVSEIEKKLKTNAASGLSRKAARSRCSEKNGKIFSLSVKSPLSYLGQIVADFAYIMLMVMSFLALCFGENDVGIVATGAIVLNLFASFITYYRSQYFCDSLESLFLPRCRVVRDGKLFSVNGADVVRGDVIILQEGDIVPADARLITSSNLRVKMLVEKDRYEMLDKAAEGRVYENELNPVRFCNMVHAASVVIGGSARAIVTDVGQYTYVGAKIGKIESESNGRKRIPKILSLFKKYTSKLGMILMITVLPFSILSMLLGNNTLSLFSAFVTAIAIAATSMSQLSFTVCKVFYTTSMKRCIKAYEPSVIRSVDTADRLAGARYLFLLDGAIFTDGILHFEKSVTVDGESSLGEGERVGAVEKRLGELAALYASVQGNALSLGTESLDRYSTAIREFTEKAAADKGALGIRCNVTGFTASSKEAGAPHDRLFYSEFGEKYMLSVSYTDSIIYECTECLSGGGRTIFSAEEKTLLSSKYKKEVDTGKQVAVFSLCRHDGKASFGNNCFVGMLVFGEAYDEFASKTLESIRELGLMPVFFRNTTVDSVKINTNALPLDITGEKSVSADDFSRRGLNVAYGFGKINSYSGFSDRQICELIDAAHAKGEKVAVCGFEERYERVYSKADVLISFSSDDYKVKGGFEEEISVLKTYDDPSRAEVSEIHRRNSDMLIPRPNKKRRGGCESLLGALRESLSACTKAAGFFRYVVCMHIVRLVLIMVPMLFGSSALDARHVVVGGFIADLFVLFSYLLSKQPKISKRAYDKAVREMTSPIENNAAAILCFSASALVASVLPELMPLIPGVPKYIDRAEYSLVVFALLHIAVYLCLKLDLRLDNLGELREKGKKPEILTVIYPLFMVVFTLLCFLSPRFSGLFLVQGFTSLAYLFVAFIPPVAGMVCYFFFGSVRINFKKHRSDL